MSNQNVKQIKQALIAGLFKIKHNDKLVHIKTSKYTTKMLKTKLLILLVK